MSFSSNQCLDVVFSKHNYKNLQFRLGFQLDFRLDFWFAVLDLLLSVLETISCNTLLRKPREIVKNLQLQQQQ